MPALYVAIRESCYDRIRKKNGKLSEKDIANCKKMAAITYWKKTGKPVRHEAESDYIDEVDLEILSEQMDIFGSLREYDSWNE